MEGLWAAAQNFFFAVPKKLIKQTNTINTTLTAVILRYEE